MTRANPSKARLTSLSLSFPPSPSWSYVFHLDGALLFESHGSFHSIFIQLALPSLSFISIDLSFKEKEREREKGREEERESKRFRFKQKDLTSQLGIDGDRHDARILINFLFFDRVSMPPLFLPSLHPPPPWPPPRLFIYRWNGPSQRRRKWQTADIDTAVIEQLSISFLICRAFENLWIFFPILLTFIFFSLLFLFFFFFFFIFVSILLALLHFS